MIDRYSRWMEVVPIPNIKAETVVKAIMENGTQNKTGATSFR